jgi:formylglycine-generating enzyme required for sulfatase activity
MPAPNQPVDRRKLIDTLVLLTAQEIKLLKLRVNIPNFILPGEPASLIDHIATIIQWAEGPNGCGLAKLQDEVNRLSLSVAPSTGVQSPTEGRFMTELYTNPLGMEFVLISSGKFLMGSKQNWDEEPVHEVNIKNSFYLGKYQVTQGEWEKVMGKNPSQLQGDAKLPVETVSWIECQDFLKELNSRDEKMIYRLPSEAEWEYACRAGKGGKEFSFGNKLTSRQATYNWCYPLVVAPKRYRFSYPQKTTPVGTYAPNAFGLYDMHGNVQEWCQDRWHPNYKNAPNDGSAWETGTDYNRLVRGGAWADPAYRCRSAFRVSKTQGDKSSNIGLRVVAVLK